MRRFYLASAAIVKGANIKHNQSQLLVTKHKSNKLSTRAAGKKCRDPIECAVMLEVKPNKTT